MCSSTGQGGGAETGSLMIDHRGRAFSRKGKVRPRLLNPSSKETVLSGL